MIKTLPQIITPFLALGVTLLIAYLIYLYSSQANIDEKIQLEGSEITIELKKASTYKMSLTLSGLCITTNGGQTPKIDISRGENPLIVRLSSRRRPLLIEGK